MTDERAKGSVIAAGVQQCFETAGRAAEIVDGADTGDMGRHRFSVRGRGDARVIL